MPVLIGAVGRIPDKFNFCTWTRHYRKGETLTNGLAGLASWRALAQRTQRVAILVQKGTGARITVENTACSGGCLAIPFIDPFNTGGGL